MGYSENLDIMFDGQDEDEDLESYMANSRARRVTVVLHDKRQADDTSDSPTLNAKSRSGTGNDFTPVSRQSVHPQIADADWDRNDAEQVFNEHGTDIDHSTLGLDKFDWPSRRGFRDHTPPCQLQNDGSSSLFVQQDEQRKPMFQTYLSKNINQLVPVSKIHSQGLEKAHAIDRKPSAFGFPYSRQQNSSTRCNTMTDAFASKEYVDKIKQNPYTSGLFQYQAPNRAEVLKQLKYSVKSTKSSTRTAVKARNIAATSDPATIEQYSRSQTSGESEKLLLPLTSSKRGRTRSSSTVEPRSKCRVTSGSADASLAGDELEPTKFELSQQQQLTSSISTQLWTSQTPNAINVSEFLRDHVQKYKTVLEKIGCFPPVNSQQWEVLKKQIQHEIDVFAQNLDSQHSADIEGLKSDIKAWDTNLGVQVLLKRYVMYDSLLNITLLRNAD